MTSTLKATWETKDTVCVRCGGRGEEMVGETLTAHSAKKGSRHYVRLAELVKDYGEGDVAEFRVEFL